LDEIHWLGLALVGGLHTLHSLTEIHWRPFDTAGGPVAILLERGNEFSTGSGSGGMRRSVLDAQSFASAPRIEATLPLMLIKLAGPGLAILGATAEVTRGGLAYDVPQAWSKALRLHRS
jgi:hypothetical protein